MAACSLLFGLEPRIVAQMNEQPAVELSVTQFRPPAPTPRIVVVLSLSREFDATCCALGFHAAIELALDGTELEMAKIVLLKRDVTGHNHIDVVAISLLHCDDTPAAKERICTLGYHGSRAVPVVRRRHAGADVQAIRLTLQTRRKTPVQSSQPRRGKSAGGRRKRNSE
jgi:hypothetical protein